MSLVDWSSEQSKAFESAVTSLILVLRERLRSLKSEADGGNEALDAEQKACGFMESKRDKLQEQYDAEGSWNENVIKGKTDQLHQIQAELHQVDNLNFVSLFQVNDYIHVVKERETNIS